MYDIGVNESSVIRYVMKMFEERLLSLMNVAIKEIIK